MSPSQLWAVDPFQVPLSWWKIAQTSSITCSSWRPVDAFLRKLSIRSTWVLEAHVCWPLNTSWIGIRQLVHLASEIIKSGVAMALHWFPRPSWQILCLREVRSSVKRDRCPRKCQKRHNKLIRGSSYRGKDLARRKSGATCNVEACSRRQHHPKSNSPSIITELRGRGL